MELAAARSATGRLSDVDSGGRGLFVAVEGPTGVGKTTLVNRLSQPMDAKPFLDRFEANPFLERLYAARTPQEADAFGLLAELTFVALRVVQLREIHTQLAAGAHVLADWAMVKHAAFAAATLDPADRDRVARTCALWASDVPSPDLVIHLRADPATLLSRVAGRGREMERGLTEAYFSTLSAAFDSVLPAWGAPVLTVDAASLDVFNESAVARLADQVFQLLDGRGDRLWSALNP
ncbi:deoxynucleoside kinase [Phytohabitans rumicis]|uniref:Deoxyguanosine kinase/deoxyadenosine kinase n=1 Tax=Phytohabitans rumicis TaxID=1076125 RepID=A0A6V8KVE6_9ACTN|nr:deoxynucleoside kinase [Phytohabitans rumicis]GFJ86381.1 deoxyguanosine kinase/deoxyadenosine kinase [Phytohabitans rumicis]